MTDRAAGCPSPAAAWPAPPACHADGAVQVKRKRGRPRKQPLPAETAKPAAPASPPPQPLSAEDLQVNGGSNQVPVPAGHQALCEQLACTSCRRWACMVLLECWQPAQLQHCKAAGKSLCQRSPGVIPCHRGERGILQVFADLGPALKEYRQCVETTVLESEGCKVRASVLSDAVHASHLCMCLLTF